MFIAPGSQGAAVRSIQEMLVFLGFRHHDGSGATLHPLPLVADGIFGEITEAIVVNFQRSEGIHADGLVGPQTMRALEAAYTARRLELDSPGADALIAGVDRFHLERMAAEAHQGDGYTRVSLRADAAQAYGKVHDTLRAQGGKLTSSGGIRNLNATVSSNRSPTSFHYTGRALDLYIYSGMVDPETDPYVLEYEGDRRFRVWARCVAEQGQHVELPEQCRIHNVMTYRDQSGDRTVSGHFLDLTALFEANGFKPIRARQRFFASGSMMSAEWWHFQWETGLIEGQSTFGSELLKLYRHETVEPTPPWRSRDRVFGIDWF